MKILNAVLDKMAAGSISNFLRALGERTCPVVGVVGAFFDLGLEIVFSTND